MASLSRFFPGLVLSVCLAQPSNAAAPATCESLLTRMETLSTAMDKERNKKILAKRQAELDKLADQYAARCSRQPAGRQAAMANRPRPMTIAQEEYPEDEIRRRRAMINQKKQQVDSKAVARAIPVEGSIQIESGTSSAFHGKVKQELSYTIRETFVGNLIITRSAQREDYVIQTLSTEIDAATFKGRSCAKYTGSPPVCSQWHKLDVWQIADGEEYPGRFDGVISATSDSQGVTIKIDGPDIEFASSQGPATIKPRCGDQIRMTVSRSEFRQWLQRSNVQIKRELGKASPGCRPGSTVTVEMRFGSEP